MFDEKGFLKLLVELGWIINEDRGTIISSDMKTYSLKEIEGRLREERKNLQEMVGSDMVMVEMHLNSRKDQILKDLVTNARDKFGLEYNSDKKCFVQGEYGLTVQETVLRISLHLIGVIPSDSGF